MTPSPTLSSSQIPRAFSLIEILATVAIISFLAALLAPAVTNMRRQGLQTKCVSNLRQIGAAMNLHAAENQGLYPYTFGDPAPDPSVVGGWSNGWASRIVPYLDAKGNAGYESASDILSCPSRTEAVSVNKATYGINSYMRIGYGGWVVDPTDPKWNYVAARVPSPSRIILVGDMRAADDQIVPTSDQKSYLGDQSFGPGFRHGPKDAATVDKFSRANVVFCDGHVEGLSPAQLRLFPADLAANPADQRSRWKWW